MAARFAARSRESRTAVLFFHNNFNNLQFSRPGCRTIVPHTEVVGERGPPHLTTSTAVGQRGMSAARCPQLKERALVIERIERHSASTRARTESRKTPDDRATRENLCIRSLKMRTSFITKAWRRV
jgi:hypothetical protein